MAKSRVKGIVVEIGGDVTSLSKAIQSVTADARDTQAELNKVNRLLKMDPDNVVLLRQKQELLNQSIERTESVLTSLRDAKDKADADMANGTEVNEKAYRELERQIEYSEIALRNTRKEADDLSYKLRDVDEQPVEEVADAADEAEDALSDAKKEAASFGDVLKAGALIEGAKSLIGAISDLSAETQEYRKIMGTLEVSSEQAGYSAEQTAMTYQQLYGVLADDQTAATTTANLQALGSSQQELTELVDSAIGAWAKYGDSIPIDSLAESINETVKAGQVTGTFADVLNWGSKEGETFGVALKKNIDFAELTEKELESLTDAQRAEYEAIKAQHEAIEDWNSSVSDAATAEDYFNLALSQCSSEAERANLVMSAMAEQGLSESSEAWRQNNADILAANQAQADFTEKTAEMAERVAPAIQAVKEGGNDLLQVFLDATSDVDFEALAEKIDAVFGAAAVLFAFIMDNKEIILSALTGFAGGIAALKLVDLVGKISNVTFGVQTLSSVFPGLSSAIGLLTNPVFLVGAAIVALVALIATKGDEIQAILQKVDDFMQGVFATDFTTIFGPVLGGQMNAFFAMFQGVWDAVVQIFNGVIDFIRGVFTCNWEQAWSGVQQIFGGIFDGLVWLAKSPINAIISLLNAAIDGVNWFIRTLNSIPGININTIGHIPMLASGGILSSGSAIVGEAGPELLTVAGGRAIVQPLTSATNNATNLGGVNITIYGAPGQSEEDLVDILMDRMQHECDLKGAAIHG